MEQRRHTIAGGRLLGDLAGGRMNKLTERSNDMAADEQSLAPHANVLHAARAAWSEPLLAAGSLALYVGLEWLSFLHQHDGLPVTPWNPGLGLMLALIIIRGAGYAVVLFIGVVLAELLVLRSELPLHVMLAVGAIIAVVYCSVAMGARKLLQLDRQVFHTRDILVLLGAGLTGATAVSALLSLLLLSLRYFDLSDIARTVAPLVLGDVIGIVVVTPLVLRAHLQQDQLRQLSLTTLAEFAAYGGAVLGVLALTTWPGHNQQHLFYLLFLPVVVAAVRYGIDGTCAMLAIVQLMVVGILHYQGFDLSLFTEYQFQMLVLTLTGLVVGALVSERQMADLRAREASDNLRQITAEAARAARLNLVSGMASALAHEINQPMTAARALARSVQQLLITPAPDTKRVEANVATMIEQIDHASAVVHRMREFLRRGEPHLSTLDIGFVLEEAIALVKPLARSDYIDIRLEIDKRLPNVCADRVQIQQVIINLAGNGIEAVKDSGRRDGSIVVSAGLAVASQAIEISVTDNGTGIAPEAAAALFEPLNTSRPEGIGLGLSICKTIVQAHGGQIWLASSMPGRTTFRFTLPAMREAKSGD